MKLGNILQSTNLILSVIIVILLIVIIFFAKKEYFETTEPTPTNNYDYYNLPSFSVTEIDKAIHDFITKQTNIPHIPQAEINSSLEQLIDDQNIKIPTVPSSTKIILPEFVSDALKKKPEEEENHTLPTNITLLTNATAPS